MCNVAVMCVHVRVCVYMCVRERDMVHGLILLLL